MFPWILCCILLIVVFFLITKIIFIEKYVKSRDMLPPLKSYRF